MSYGRLKNIKTALNEEIETLRASLSDLFATIKKAGYVESVIFENGNLYATNKHHIYLCLGFRNYNEAIKPLNIIVDSLNKSSIDVMIKQNAIAVIKSFIIKIDELETKYPNSKMDSVENEFSLKWQKEYLMLYFLLNSFNDALYSFFSYKKIALLLDMKPQTFYNKINIRISSISFNILTKNEFENLFALISRISQSLNNLKNDLYTLVNSESIKTFFNIINIENNRFCLHEAPHVFEEKFYQAQIDASIPEEKIIKAAELQTIFNQFKTDHPMFDGADEKILMDLLQIIDAEHFIKTLALLTESINNVDVFVSRPLDQSKKRSSNDLPNPKKPKNNEKEIAKQTADQIQKSFQNLLIHLSKFNITDAMLANYFSVNEKTIRRWKSGNFSKSYHFKFITFCQTYCNNDPSFSRDLEEFINLTGFNQVQNIPSQLQHSFVLFAQPNSSVSAKKETINSLPTKNQTPNKPSVSFSTSS